MNIFSDKSNLEETLHTLKWGKIMLYVLAEKTDSAVILGRTYVNNDNIAFAFSVNGKKYSVTVPLTSGTRDFYKLDLLVRSAEASYVAVETNYQHFVNNLTMKNEPLFT